MSKYATQEKFAGQRASIGRDVVVGTQRGPMWGKISYIDHEERLYLFVPPIGMSAKVEGVQRGYTFKETKTEADVEQLKEFEWTWPVRV